ncbi:MAG: NosD domain-containing protein [Bryobacteraceae bacterium]
MITGNRFIRGSVFASGSHNNRITDNEVQMTGEGPGVVLFPVSAYNVIARNRFFPAPDALPMCFAVRIVGSPYPNYILDNTVTGNRYAFLISYSSNTVVAGNKLSNIQDYRTFAIHLHHSHDVQILNNEISDTGLGIMLFGSPRNQIRGNRIANGAWGLALVSSPENTVSGNVFFKNQDNVVALDSNSNNIQANSFHRAVSVRQVWDDGINNWRSNYWDDAPAPRGPYPIEPATMDVSPAREAVPLVLATVPAVVSMTPQLPVGQSVDVTKNEVWDNCEKRVSSISVQSGATLIIRNCRIAAEEGSFGSGIGVGPGGRLEIYNSTIEGNSLDSTFFGVGTSPGAALVIRDSRIRNLSPWDGGINLGGDNAVIENNEITGNYFGIEIELSKGHRIVNNRISGSYVGIRSLDVSSDMLIQGNTITKCYLIGIEVGPGARNQVIGNRVEGSIRGISVGGSGDIIRGNQVTGNAAGMEFTGTGHIVYENSFVANGRFSVSNVTRANATIEFAGGTIVSPQTWSQGGRGNYWSDYTGADFNGDGIGDQPHNAGPGITDPFPLMAPPAEASCRYLLSGQRVFMPGTGGDGFADVLGGGQCAWTAESQTDWITIAPGTGGTGAGRAWFRAAVNPYPIARTGTVLVAGQKLLVDQAAAGCTYFISPSVRVAPSEGESSTVSVRAPAGCPWRATRDTTALNFDDPQFGWGDGEVRYWFPANPGPTRSWRTEIAGREFMVVQLAAGGGMVIPPNAVRNAASGTNPSGLAPGTFASIFGVGLGRPGGVIATGLQRGLADTRVFFGGTEAFLTYASWNQVNALMPNGLQPGAQVPVRVEFMGGSAEFPALPVAAVSPGIFTMDSSGAGAAVVINQDQTFNSASNAAARGSIVTFFVTGYGVTDPPSIDGQHPAPPVYPRPIQPMSVSFGDVQTKDIQFSGVIFTGVLQVNVRIPAGAPTGDRVALAVRFACGSGLNCDSQAGVTLAVK